MTQLARGRSGRQGELGLGRGRAEARRCPGREPRACAGPARGGRHDRQGFGFGSGEPTGSRDRPACASESGRLVPGAAEVAARMQKARGGTAKGKRPEEEGKQVERTVSGALGRARGRDRPASHRGTRSHVPRQRPPRQPLPG